MRWDLHEGQTTHNASRISVPEDAVRDARHCDRGKARFIRPRFGPHERPQDCRPKAYSVAARVGSLPAFHASESRGDDTRRCSFRDHVRAASAKLWEAIRVVGARPRRDEGEGALAW